MASKRNRTAYESDLQSIQSPYVFYGTPLPPLDSNIRDDGSFVPIWKQEVTDERGRKRLHGAFTGGFSAGYFNTVGSKEGWTPATFVSSKSNRWKDSGSKTQKAEDYMDEEDKAEAEEARQVSTKTEFAGLGTTEDEVNKKAPLMDLFRSAGDTKGYKLLRTMGWKDGQGIGPRVWRNAVLDEETSAPEKHLFAPNNSNVVLIIRKNDRKGLGYQSEASTRPPKGQSVSMPENDEDDFSKPMKKQPPKKGAFGVGVLNDTGSDDEDPFSLGPKISYSKVLGGEKKKKKKSTSIASTVSNPLLTKKPVFISNRSGKGLAGFRKCHDGRLPLEGFILSASVSLIASNKYPPPDVPGDWKPSRIDAEAAHLDGEWQSSTDLAKAPKLDATTRGSILGEAPLPGKSVFDFMKPEGRAKLVTLTNNQSLPPARAEAGPTPAAAAIDPSTSMPPLDSAIAASALGRGVGGFVPYTDNPDKLARYRAYLSFSAGITAEVPSQPKTLPKDEWIRELQEFAHAATIFKPMTGSIATRFTSVSTASLQQDASKSADSGEYKERVVKATVPKDPAEEAAAMNMFGHLTRSSTMFYPNRLLCKRFNVPVPAHVHSGNEGISNSSNSTARSNQHTSAASYPAAIHASIPASGQPPSFNSRFQSTGYQFADNKEPVSISISSAAQTAAGDINSQKTNPPPKSHGESGSEQIVGQVDPDRNEALEAARADDDVFRAVFGSDSEDE